MIPQYQIDAEARLVPSVFERFEDGTPIPYPTKLKWEENPTIAHVLVSLGVFSSLTQARKNMPNGEELTESNKVYELTKRKLRVVLE